jgi:heme O synthase-like polyprenyltransferase
MGRRCSKRGHRTYPYFEYSARRQQAGRTSDYCAPTRPEVNFLIAIATFTGLYLAFPGPLARFPWLLLVHTLLGTLLVASGTGTLKYIARRSTDKHV